MKQDWEIYRDTGILGAYRPEQVILRRIPRRRIGNTHRQAPAAHRHEVRAGAS